MKDTEDVYSEALRSSQHPNNSKFVYWVPNLGSVVDNRCPIHAHDFALFTYPHACTQLGAESWLRSCRYLLGFTSLCIFACTYVNVSLGLVAPPDKMCAVTTPDTLVSKHHVGLLAHVIGLTVEPTHLKVPALRLSTVSQGSCCSLNQGKLRNN
jgi:hypothetical protein